VATSNKRNSWVGSKLTDLDRLTELKFYVPCSRHKIGQHFRDILPSQSLDLIVGTKETKLTNNTGIKLISANTKTQKNAKYKQVHSNDI